MSRSITPLIVFFALVLAASFALNALIVATAMSTLALTALMWSVGLSAIAAMKLTGRPLYELGWSFGPAKYHLIALALPFVYGTLAFGLAGVLGLASFPDAAKATAFLQTTNLSSLPAPLGAIALVALITTAGMIQSMTTALGEEIGWRGFLVPRLVAMSGFVAGTLITGVLWGLWHMPLIVLSGYNGGGNVGFEVLSFALGVVAMSGPMTWLRLKSDSLWPCATFHAAHNLFVQGVLDRLTTRGVGEITVVGEFGIVFAAAVVLVSFPFWRDGRRARLFPARTSAREANGV